MANPKQCFCCGSIPVVETVRMSVMVEPDGYQVRCSNPKCTKKPSVMRNSRNKAVIAWNYIAGKKS